jgi:class 3 adenylate cyclase
MDSPKPRAEALATLRHELHTPMNHIIGYSEMLIEEAHEIGGVAFLADLERILAAGRRLNSLIDKVFSGRDDEEGRLNHRDAQHHFLTSLNQILGYSEMLEELASDSGQSHMARDLQKIQSAARLLLGMVNENLGSLEPIVTDGRASAPEPTSTRLFVRPPAKLSETSPRAESEQGVILIVDDNEENRDMLARRLTRLGYEVVQAESGSQGLERLKAKPVDLVLLDLLMPGMNGYQVLEQMRADAALRDIPVIVLSALDMMESVVKCVEMGAQDYLPKPFDPVLLRARIGACLEKKRLRDREVMYLRQIEEEKKRSDDLLHVILPHYVAEELKKTKAVKPRRHDDVGVLFCDVVGFTSFCDKHAAEEVLEHLQPYMHAFEKLAGQHGLEKIKTIGDSFMAAAGLLNPLENPALNCVRCGLDMVAATRKLPGQWQVRVGVHVGPVIAGVVGTKKYQFDIWGDAVNTAQRIESLARPNTVYISGEGWTQIAQLCSGHSGGILPVKGKGELEVFRVEAVRTS